MWIGRSISRLQILTRDDDDDDVIPSIAKGGFLGHDENNPTRENAGNEEPRK